MGIKNTFGWSISRESTFDSCGRKYWFHYYGSWGGWNSSSSPLCREAFKLKRLTSLPLWRGQLVHYVTTKVLESMRRKRRLPDPGDVTAYTLERFEKQFEFSRDKLYLTTPKKKQGKLNIDWLALFEHEYGREFGEGRIEGARQECVDAMEGLLESEILGRIMDTDSSDWVIENIDLAEFAQVFWFEGAQVFAKTDFIFRGSEETFNIVDWKTFRPKPGPSVDEGKAGTQLGVYGYYAAEIMREPLDSIRLFEVNLLDGGRTVEHSIGSHNIDMFKEHIDKGISKLATVLKGGNIEANEALDPSHFPCNVTGLCRYCNFYRICQDETSELRLE